MLAGQETSACVILGSITVVWRLSLMYLSPHLRRRTALAWALYALCENLEIQDKLRAELIACPTDEPSMCVRVIRLPDTSYPLS